MDQEITPVSAPAEPISPQPASSPRDFHPFLVFVGIILFVLVGAGGIFLGKSLNTSQSSARPTVAPISTQIQTPTPDPTANWKTYTNGLWNYSIKYPEDKLVACQYGDGNSQGFWPTPFNCPIGHDQIYEIGIVGSKPGEYKPYKKPASVKEIVINGIPAIQNQYIYGPEDGPLVDYKESTEIVFTRNNGTVIVQYIGTDKNKLKRFNQILSTFKFLESQKGDTTQKYYSGKISPQIPYSGLKFIEINVHDFSSLNAELSKEDYYYQDSVIDGYTFVANQGEDFEFLAQEDRNSNPGSFIETELYGWGPTVIKMGTRIGWGVPATTRYFYVVKGKDFYGPNYSVSGVTPFDGSKYGKYQLIITQRK